MEEEASAGHYSGLPEQTSQSKGNQPEYWLKGLMLKLNLILWPPDVKSQPTGKGPDAGKD